MVAQLLLLHVSKEGTNEGRKLEKQNVSYAKVQKKRNKKKTKTKKSGSASHKNSTKTEVGEIFNIKFLCFHNAEIKV